MQSKASPRVGRVLGPVLPTRSDRQSFIKDLTKITKPELLEILEREEKLLRNKAKLEKLPDKGQKIRDYHAKVQAEIHRRNEVDNAADLFSQLNIASVGKQALNNLEWTGSTKVDDGGVVDSDDDEDVDPLKIIAGSNEVNKIVKIEKPETLITQEDLKEIESFADEKVENFGIKNKSRLTKLISKIETKAVENENQVNEMSVLLEPHALHLCEIETHSDVPSRPKFLPGRTTRTDVHKPETEMKRRQAKNWEATAATPPLFRHSGVKTLSLQESIEAQKKNFDQCKKLQAEFAQERLVQREIRMRDRTIINCLNDDLVHFADYRDPADAELEIDSDDEVHDDEDVEDKGGISYNIET